MSEQYIAVDRNAVYREFLSSKQFTLDSSGFSIDRENLNPYLFDFQRDIVRWALAKGRAAVFASCGLGKTLIQPEWAHQICKYLGDGARILILAPLAVSTQTKREGEKFGIDVTLCESQADVQPGINITNYEKLDKFIAKEFDGVVLDESSILKSFTGKIRTQIIESFANVPYKLACTATPAPNDYMELGNHSEFLGVMTRAEMLAMYFVHDGGQTSKWRLKGHAESLFWQWMASWAVFIDNPINLGYETTDYNLPPLYTNEVIVDGDEPVKKTLTLTQRRDARRDSLDLRCRRSVDIIDSAPDEQFIVWCGLNAEQDELEKLLGDRAVSIRGSTPNDKKIEHEWRWRSGEVPILITKPECCAFGLNWQHCHNMIFTGLSDSYEQYYQALRRCWRFGQTHDVNVYIVISAAEGCVKENIERKEADFVKMQTEMIKLTKEITKKELKKTCRISTPYTPTVTMVLPRWEEFRV